MKIIFSCGDCNGIGFEVFLKSIQYLSEKRELTKDLEFSIATNLNVLKNQLRYFNLENIISRNTLLVNNIKVNIVKCESHPKIEFGSLSKSAGELASESIEKAVQSVIFGNHDAIVTLPVSKEALYLAGWKYPGHTEMLADVTGCKNFAMILMTKKIKVALATVHIPIKHIPKFLNKIQLLNIISLLNKCLNSDFGIINPKLAVLGLNPHAGENGKIGNEEETIINPVISKLNHLGLNVNGPFPADGFFAHGDFKNYDGILAMYHDQGLIPLKLLAKGGGVNYTAGLPIVRTSPDHGTAFPIAGKGVADPKSTIEAILTAKSIFNNRKKIREYKSSF